jgi:hypothetical protein
MATPASPIFAPSRSTIRNTSHRSALSATRMAISCVRSPLGAKSRHRFRRRPLTAPARRKFRAQSSKTAGRDRHPHRDGRFSGSHHRFDASIRAVASHLRNGCRMVRRTCDFAIVFGHAVRRRAARPADVDPRFQRDARRGMHRELPACASRRSRRSDRRTPGRIELPERAYERSQLDLTRQIWRVRLGPVLPLQVCAVRSPFTHDQRRCV